MSIRVLDAVKLSRLGEIPEIPSEAARRGLKVGDRAGVLVQEGTERRTIFVSVVGVEGSRYSGAPESSEDAGGQNRVSFGPSAVVEVPGAGRKTMYGLGLIAAGLVGLWWESNKNATEARAKAERDRQAQLAPQAILGGIPNPAANVNQGLIDNALQFGVADPSANVAQKAA